MRTGLATSGATIFRNPIAVGGSTAFFVAMFYVSANALWYQPHFHHDAFIATRAAPVVQPDATPEDRLSDDQPAGDTTFVIEHDADPTNATATAKPETMGDPAIDSMAAGDPLVEQVQQVLSELNLYGGAIDGLSGPKTNSAIEDYQRIVGIAVTGKIDDALLRQLGELPTLPASAPPPPDTRPETTASIAPAKSDDASNDQIIRIQAGLKAFGNDGIEMDGVVGSRTRAAIREFQSLFGLPVTGEPDLAVAQKMREIGLTE